MRNEPRARRSRPPERCLIKILSAEPPGRVIPSSDRALGPKGANRIAFLCSERKFVQSKHSCCAQTITMDFRALRGMQAISTSETDFARICEPGQAGLTGYDGRRARSNGAQVL
jgi:hypothetical protein